METINHITSARGGYFYYEENGKKVAKLVYHNSGVNLIVIEHTDIDSCLQGRGIGRQLLCKLVGYVRENNIKVIPLCPFAKAIFEKTPEWQDVLSNIHVKSLIK
jgi:uncharacterized protein